MKGIRTVLCIIAILGAIETIAQGDWQPQYEIPGQNGKAWIDQLNYVYVLSSGEIVKYDPEGVEICRYSNKLIGPNVQLDVTNPMKVLLFSPDQMRILFLDSRLGEINETLDLYRQGYEQVTLAASSFGNGFWIYDPVRFQLIRFHQNLTEDYRSLNLSQLLRVAFYPTHLIEVNQKVYLSDPEQGIFVFDVYGNFIRKIPILHVDRPVICNNLVFYHREEKFFVLDLETLEEEELLIKVNGWTQMDTNNKRLCLSKPDRILIFKYDSQ